MAFLYRHIRVTSRDGGEGADLTQKPWAFPEGEPHWFGTTH